MAMVYGTATPESSATIRAKLAVDPRRLSVSQLRPSIATTAAMPGSEPARLRPPGAPQPVAAAAARKAAAWKPATRPTGGGAASCRSVKRWSHDSSMYASTASQAALRWSRAAGTGTAAPAACCAHRPCLPVPRLRLPLALGSWPQASRWAATPSATAPARPAGPRSSDSADAAHALAAPCSSACSRGSAAGRRQCCGAWALRHQLAAARIEATGAAQVIPSRGLPGGRRQAV
mmetsp:Transcript_934/g.2785  ORF Transcript_934/g.2785 Transcript_934/m.2785 type:complete len:233 (+) Transcript_934:1337-2035(+)